MTKNHAWSETWGFGTENADYSIQDDGEYNITFKFNPDAAFDNGFNVDVVVEKILPVLNTYEVMHTYGLSLTVRLFPWPHGPAPA